VQNEPITHRALNLKGQKMTPTPQTARYELLCTALEKMIVDPRTSKRVRLTAITRLDDLLKRAERKEEREARRQEREALRAAQREEQVSQQTVTTAPDATEEIERANRMREHLVSISKRTKKLQNSLQLDATKPPSLLTISLASGSDL
jgi:hypothetical protein